MTNAELLAKIKAEIERRLKKYATDVTMPLEVLGKVILELKELLSFLSTLESEKPMNLEEEINRYLHEECSDDDEPGIHEIAEHFAQWGAEHFRNTTKMISGSSEILKELDEDGKNL